MQKKFDNLFSALMLAAGVAVVLIGGWCLSRSIARAGEAAPIPVASVCIRLPEPEPTLAPEPTPAYDPAIPLSAELQAVLFDACAEHGVPVALALGVIHVESRFQVDAVSSDGCVGLMQINPSYAWKMEEITGYSYLTPEGNLRCGIWYLSGLIKQYEGSVEMALVAYNQGSYRGTVTQYAKRVLEASAKWDGVCRNELSN